MEKGKAVLYLLPHRTIKALKRFIQLGGQTDSLRLAF
jgi:hypothetical protein